MTADLITEARRALKGHGPEGLYDDMHQARMWMRLVQRLVDALDVRQEQRT
jgi:hypothetical protein